MLIGKITADTYLEAVKIEVFRKAPTQDSVTQNGSFSENQSEWMFRIIFGTQKK